MKWYAYRFIHDQMKTIGTSRIDIVMQRHWPNIGVHDMAGLRDACSKATQIVVTAIYLIVKEGDPFCELFRVGNSGGQKDVMHVVRQENDGLFPDDAALYNRIDEGHLKSRSLPLSRR